MEKLARDADEAVRQWVAQNPNLPHNLLVTLASDSSAKVRSTVAGMKLPQDVLNQILEQLANDEDSGVRITLGRNPNAPATVLEKLSGDKEYSVRSWLSTNPNLPVSAIERLEHLSIIHSQYCKV